LDPNQKTNGFSILKAIKEEISSTSMKLTRRDQMLKEKEMGQYVLFKS